MSPPVPLDLLFERIGHLARLRTAIVNLNGGEPLLHPGRVEVVARIRDRGMVPALAARTGHRVLDVGVRWQDDAGSRVRPLRHLGEVVGDAIALRRNLARDVYRAGPRT